jgi:hypothetical protein
MLRYFISGESEWGTMENDQICKILTNFNDEIQNWFGSHAF